MKHSPDELIPLTVHSSQFPEQVRADLLDSLRRRSVRHKFHYESWKQAAHWLELHRNYSPAVTDPEAQNLYREAARAAAQAAGQQVEMICLGCGGAGKDLQLVEGFLTKGTGVACTVQDVSTSMVLTAWSTLRGRLPVPAMRGLVADLEAAPDWWKLFPRAKAGTTRVVTFFGLLPNFEPEVLRELALLLEKGDQLLVSANLAPGDDYAAGVRQVLALYDNQATRQWLGLFLQDLGVLESDGAMEFGVETGAKDLLRITVDFRFSRAMNVRVLDEEIAFESGEALRLFFSYRHTAERLEGLLGEANLWLEKSWVTSSGEEGVFLFRG